MISVQDSQQQLKLHIASQVLQFDENKSWTTITTNSLT